MKAGDMQQSQNLEFQREHMVRGLRPVSTLSRQWYVTPVVNSCLTILSAVKLEDNSTQEYIQTEVYGNAL